MKERMSRRDFLRTSAITVVGATLAGCAAPTPETQIVKETVEVEVPVEQTVEVQVEQTVEVPVEVTAVPPPEPTPAPTEPFTLEVWMTDWGKDWNEPMLNLANFFMEENPHITVDWTFHGEVYQKTIAAFAAGTPPDGAIKETPMAWNLARMGAVVNLGPYYEASGIKGEEFVQSCWPSVVFKGDPYGMPCVASTLLLCVNKPALEEIGLSEDQWPETPKWDDWVDWVHELTIVNSDGELEQLGYEIGAYWKDAYFWGLLGFEYYDENLTQIACNSEKSVAGMERFLQVVPEGITWEEILRLRQSAPAGWNAGFGSGLFPMTADGWWIYLPMNDLFPDLDYGVMPLPTMNGRRDEWTQYTGHSVDYMIPTASAHPDASWELSKFAFYDHAEYMADAAEWPTALHKFDGFVERAIDILGADDRVIPYLDVFGGVQADGAYYRPMTPIFDAYTRELENAIQEALSGLKTVQEAMDDAAALLQPELTEGWTNL